MFRMPHSDVQLAVFDLIMPHPCYRLRLPFLALPLGHDTRLLPSIGEHLVTDSVTEVRSVFSALS